MVTKERLGEAIRRVIGEFKRTKRIPETAADELTAALDARVDDLFEQEAASRLDGVSAIAPATDAEFEADMRAFSEGTERLPTYTGTYSRSDIYFDHD